jgi:hypothetical protein
MTNTIDTIIKNDDNTYRIIVNKPEKLDDIIVNDIIMTNDIFSKFNINLKGEMIIYKSNENIEYKSRKYRTLHKETYEQYINKINKINPSNTLWVQNIITGISEQDKIIYSDDQFILLPNFTWNESYMEKFHLLALIKSNEIKSIRDLTNNDIPLLEHIHKQSLLEIKKKYNVDENKLKIYFHYPPSTWQLHIHFITNDNIYTSSSGEYTYMLNQVIFNLKLDGDYYKKIIFDCFY